MKVEALDFYKQHAKFSVITTHNNTKNSRDATLNKLVDMLSVILLTKLIVSGIL